MQSKKFPLSLALVLAMLLGMLIFGLNVASASFHIWARYLLPLVVVFFWGRRREIYIIAAFLSVLMVATFWREGGIGAADMLARQLLALLLLWSIAWLSARRLRSQDEMQQQVAARTAELAANERRYRLLAENSSDLIWATDMTGALTYVSPAVQRLRGVTPEEERASSWFDRMPPQAAARAAAAIAANLEVLRAGQPIHPASYVAPAYRSDGTLMWGETVMNPFYDEDGRPLGICGTTRDVTARHAAEEALRQSEARFNRLFDSSPVGLALTRLDNGLFREVNAAFAALIGYSREEIIGRTSMELGIIRPADRGRLTAALQEKGYFRGTDIVLATKGGEQLSTLFSIDLMDFDGEPWMLSSVVDITERKRLENALAANEAELRAVLENTSDSIWSVDRQYCLLVANSVLARGVLKDIGRPLARGECVVDEPFEAAVCAFWRPLYDRALRGESFMVEVPSSLRAGGTLACYLNPIYGADGTVAGVSGRAADITELKHYQQLLQENNTLLEQRVAERTAELSVALAELRHAGALKDDFLAMISHELRTPLTGVLSMSEMLADQIAGPLNERQTCYVKGIVVSGERLLSVVNGILGYTHLLSGKVQLQAEPCDLAFLLDNCAAAFGRRAAEKNQCIAVDVAPAGLTITSDAAAVAEVIKRLLDNAVRFTPAGGQIGLEAHPCPAPGTVDIVVWDTGVGIPADRLDHVFRPFTQVDAGLARDHEGLGLGLAYVDQMVRLLGGTLAVASTPGVGSRFTVTLRA